MDQRIIKFIKKHHVLTLATSSDNQPYCANAFYAFDQQRNLLVFTTSLTTRHGQEMESNPRIAASIVWETKLVGKVQGVQLTGKVRPASADEGKCYLKRFPYTAMAELTLWAIEPLTIKYTDNTLGFGKKLLWNAE